MIVNAKDFNCDACQNHHHCTSTINDPQWPKSKGAAPFNILEIEGVIDSDVCLKPLITVESYEWIKLYDQFKKGRYPFGDKYYGSGLYEQPHRYRQAMEVIEYASINAKPKPTQK